MATKLKIIDGPPFKKLFMYSSVLCNGDTTLTFRFKKPSEEGDDQSVPMSLRIVVFGKAYGRYETDDEYCIIAETGGSFQNPNAFDRNYFVGIYNCSTRKGEGELMKPSEFFNSAVARLLFKKAARKIDKLQKAADDGPYRIVKVAIECSTQLHQDTFVKIIGENEKAIETMIHEADLVVTDSYSNNLAVQLLPCVHLALYCCNTSRPHKGITRLDDNPEIAFQQINELIEEISGESVPAKT